MSLSAITDIRKFLLSSTTITNIVSKNDINIGWIKKEDNFPCITINQATGTDVGYLGYNTAAAGSQMRRETSTVQIDIYGNTRLQTLQIADAVVPRMISGGCRKDADIDDYLDEYGKYRKIQTYTMTKVFDD